MGGRQRLAAGGEDADAGLFAVHEAHQRKLEQARQENRDVQLGGDLVLEAGHEAAASGNGLHAVGLKLFRGLNERFQQIRRGIEQQARDVHAPDDPRYRREAVRQWVAHVPARFREQRFEAQDADGHVVIQLTTFHVRSFSVGIRRAACRMGIREKPFPPGAIPAPFPRLFLPGANLWTESAEGKAVGDGGWGDRLGGGFWGKSAAPPLNRIFPVSFSCSFPQSTGRCR